MPFALCNFALLLIMTNYKDGLRVVDAHTFRQCPHRYELRKNDPQAPLCPYGNARLFIGFDGETASYVRFTKSVFLGLLKKMQTSEKYQTLD